MTCYFPKCASKPLDISAGLCYDHFLAADRGRWVQHRKSTAQWDRQALVDLASTSLGESSEIEGEVGAGATRADYEAWIALTGMST